ncbi:MAG TPA: FliH/SctL family protein [Desulfuromonadaceae bacterium]|jgi:flagellar assembly protein FliH
MSSSNIIKATQLEVQGLSEFDFQPITQIFCDVKQDGNAGFLPMALFDPSELTGNLLADQEAAQEAVQEEPAGIFLSEEDLDQRLRESFQGGLVEGKNLAERGLLNVFRSLRSAAEDIHALREKVMRQSEDDIINLIMMVARKVILREVTQDRHILSEVIRAAISDVSTRDEITIRLNPDDHALVTSNPDEYLRKELLTDRMQLKADTAVLPGSCQIDTEMGTIDAGIDAQLDEIFRHLLEQRGLSADASGV